MAKAVRFDVRCTICKEVFQNDYVGRHTKSKHKDVYELGCIAPTTVILEVGHALLRTMESFFSPNTEDVLTSKRRRIEVTESSETSTELGLSQLDTSLIRYSDS